MKKPGKIVFYSDLHEHGFKSHSWITEDGLNSREVDAANAAKTVYEYAESINAPVCFAGDLFQIKGEMSVTGFNLLYAIISPRFSAGGPDIMIPGNHDMATPDGSKHALETFNQDKNLVVTNPTVLSPWPGVVIAAIPYPMEHGKFSQRKFQKAYNTVTKEISERAGDETRILLSHCYTNELMKKHLDRPGDVDGSFLLDFFDFAFLGHHHTHDVITKGDKKCVSIGAPLQHRFSDVGEDRGFVVLDLEAGTIKHHVIESRRFWTFNDEKEVALDKVAGNFVRVQVESKAAKTRLEKELFEAGAASFSIDIVPKTPKKSRLDIKAGAKDDEIVKKFLGSEFCVTELPKPELAALANDYLAKVS